MLTKEAKQRTAKYLLQILKLNFSPAQKGVAGFINRTIIRGGATMNQFKLVWNT